MTIDVRRAWPATLAAAATLLVAGAPTAAGQSLAPENVPEAAPAAPAFTVLKIGARGPAVRALQAKLGQPRTGRFTAATRRAVRRFQKRHALVVDGIVGPQTATALGLAVTVAATAASGATLDRIAACESGGDPTAVSADGQYRGKYQFTQQTWERMGGSGDPAAADEAEQDRVAAVLLAAEGTAPWPVCGG